MLLLLFVLSGTSIALADQAQDFETWPTTVAWETTSYNDWTLSNGQVKMNRGGFGPPIDVQCGWLHDFNVSTSSWLQSSIIPEGVVFVSVWTRQDITSGGSSLAVLQVSSNEIDWLDIGTFTIDTFDWTEQTIIVNIFYPTHLRIRKISDTAFNTYAGLDNIDVIVNTTSTTSSTSTMLFPNIDDRFIVYDANGANVIITDCDTSASGSLIFPDTIEGKSVTSIGDYAFYECLSLTSVIIPDSVTSLENNAFAWCGPLRISRFPTASKA